MEKKIFNQTLALDTAPVHVAPGGSCLITLKGNASKIKDLLMELREEIAFGMIDVEVISEEKRFVSVSIYFGKADRPDFDRVAGHWDEIDMSGEELAETDQMKGLSMRARNQVIDVM